MRIKLKNPPEFFEVLLRPENRTLKDLSTSLHINYSSLKKYRRGDLLLPEELFNKLLNLSKYPSNITESIERLEDNWGSIKAGKSSANRDLGNKRLAYARRFIKRPKLILKLNEFFYEFYGALMGDGCISKFKDWEGKERIAIYVSGNKKLDSQYLIYLRENLKEYFSISSYFYKYKSKNLCVLSIRNKKFSFYLNNLGFPTGLKSGKLKIPERFMKLHWNKQKMIIRGLFDTDGSICAKKREGYRYPQISIASKEGALLKQIYSLLRKRKYPCWISGKNLSLRGKDATIRWFDDIGSSNNRNIFKYKYWLKNRVLPPKLGP